MTSESDAEAQEPATEEEIQEYKMRLKIMVSARWLCREEPRVLFC